MCNRGSRRIVVVLEWTPMVVWLGMALVYVVT